MKKKKRRSKYISKPKGLVHTKTKRAPKRKNRNPEKFQFELRARESMMDLRIKRAELGLPLFDDDERDTYNKSLVGEYQPENEGDDVF